MSLIAVIISSNFLSLAASDACSCLIIDLISAISCRVRVSVVYVFGALLATFEAYTLAACETELELDNW